MVEITGNQRLNVVPEDTLKRTLGGLFQDRVNLISVGVATGDEREIDHRYVCSRYTNREARKFAIQFRHYQTYRLGSTRLSRNHVQGRSASAIHIGVVNVSQYLIVGVGVHRRHQAGNNTQRVMQGLYQRSQTVGRAGRVRDNLIGRFENPVIDTEYDGGIGSITVGRC